MAFFGKVCAPLPQPNFMGRRLFYLGLPAAARGMKTAGRLKFFNQLLMLLRGIRFAKNTCAFPA